MSNTKPLEFKVRFLRDYTVRAVDPYTIAKGTELVVSASSRKHYLDRGVIEDVETTVHVPFIPEEPAIVAKDVVDVADAVEVPKRRTKRFEIPAE